MDLQQETINRRKDYAREWYNKNKDKIKERSAKYRKGNKDTIRDKKREVRNNNKDKISEEKRKYYLENRERELKKANNYYKNNKPRVANARLIRLFGVTVEEYDSMLEAQGMSCAVCGSTDTKTLGRFCVDHDHATGGVRGLLCSKCNFGIGNFNDDPEIMMSAAAYIKRSR